MKPRSLAEVAAGGLCAGCGLCADGAQVTLEWDTEGEFLRPNEHGTAIMPLEDCPGARVVQDVIDGAATIDVIWGPVIAARTGAARDAEVRFQGSSGGVVTGLLMHLLATGRINGVLQVGADPERPMLGTARISRTPSEILACAGSRYAPSPTLAGIRAAVGPADRLAIVGKPCDIVGFRNLARRDPELRERIPFAFSFFCAGVPSQRASQALIRRLGAAPDDVVSFRYRGRGWPGRAAAKLRDGRELSMSYQESWGEVLSGHLQFRCKICPDGTGQFADVVGGDAWYGVDGYPDFEEQDGRSAILTRTEVGEALVADAISAGALGAQAIDLREIDKMQPYQLRRKTTVFSRVAALKLLGRPAPVYRHLGLLRAAARGGLFAQVRAFLGTASRVLFARAA